MKLTIGTITDRGLNRKREANEDRLLALAERGLFLVADGVGGRRAGEIASQTVVDVFREAFAEAPANGRRAAIAAAIEEANRRIFDASNEDVELSGMATTLVVLALEEGEAIIGHVGDSRLYRFEGGKLYCETEDHSEVEEEVRAGLLSPSLAARDPRRNVITRALGVEPLVEADIKAIAAVEGARYLLCSDGITRHVTDEELKEVLKRNLPPERLCQVLKDYCYERGAEDNLTAVIVDLGARSYEQPEATRPAAGSRITVDWTHPQAGRAVNQRSDRSSDRPTDRFPNGLANGEAENAGAEEMENVRTQPRRRKGLMGWLIVFGMVIAAFIIGRYYEDIRSWAAVQFGSGNAPAAARSGQGAQTDPDLAAARVLFDARRYDKAREQLTALAARNPETAEVRFWLGRTHYELKEYPEAIKQLEEAARLDPQWPDVHLHLARAYEAVGDRQNMQESLRRATAR